jgi:hypothetical protein
MIKILTNLVDNIELEVNELKKNKRVEIISSEITMMDIELPNGKYRMEGYSVQLVPVMTMVVEVTDK